MGLDNIQFTALCTAIFVVGTVFAWIMSSPYSRKNRLEEKPNNKQL
ncbi:MAG: hypothetical protein LBK53_00150 [Heliobacteriaceae bacterium]|jgi:hypothetical protein|nr:hypothetical protein [Heliobacteriaceae bacterium]